MKNFNIVIFLTVFYSGESIIHASRLTRSEGLHCKNVSKAILDEVRSYRPIVSRISELIVNGTFKGTTYSDLAYFVDKYGSRLTGSEALENSIDYILNKMEKIGFEDVHFENVTAPKWVRGEESLTMVKPYKKIIQVLGLLPSTATPPEGITAEIIAVGGFKELHEMVKNATNKILVFNQPFNDPSEAIKYRQMSAIAAAKLGAVASIVRSYTTFSLGTPHTGLMFYEDNLPQIPSAEISIEDAELLHRLYAKGEKVVIHLKLQNENQGNVTTRNSIGDLKGSEIPNEFVLISGHADSFDVGQGALDDGYGVILSMKAVEVLRSLNLKPRRSIRTIIWSAEEVGEVPLGAQQYLHDHLEELKTSYSMFLEADSGIFDANGLLFNGSAEAGCIVSEILKLLEPEVISETKLFPDFPRLKTDIVPLMQATGVPGALIASNFDKYFWYHHSNADTVTALNSKDLDVCLTMWSVLSYVLADLSIMLPRA